MSRKVIATGAAAMLLLAACGDNGDDPGDGGYDVTLIQGIANEPFYISMACGAQDAADKLDVTLSVNAAAQWDVAQQTRIVDSVAATSPDAVLIAPVDRVAMEGPVQQLEQVGSEVILVDTELDAPDIGVSRISSNNRLGGERAAEALADLIEGGSGDVMVLSPERGISTTDARVDGFKEKAEGDFPGLTIVSEQYPGDDAGAANQVVSATLAATPNLAGIFAANLVTGEGAAAALDSAGLTDTVKLVQFDASPGQVEALREGTIQALISQQPYEIGYQGVEQAVQALNDESVTAEIQTELTIVTADNVDDPAVSQYLYRDSC